MSGTAALTARLAAELEGYLPADLLGPLISGPALSPASLADRAIRVLLPRALEGRSAAEAAGRIRMLPEVDGPEVARTTMPALERLARATNAPPDLIRAGSQCAGALLRMAQAGGEEPGTVQLLSAVTRLVIASVRGGMPGAEVVGFLVQGT